GEALFAEKGPPRNFFKTSDASEMKVAFAIENFSLYGGGAESYAVQLAQTLVSRGHEVHFFGHQWDGEPKEAVFHKIPRLPRIVPPFVRIMHFALAHRAAVARYDFDVVVGFGNTLTMNVYQSHGGVHQRSTSRKIAAVRSPVVRLLKRLAVLFTPKHYARAWIESAAFRMNPRPIIVAISDMVRNDMAEHFGVPAHEIRLVYNGIDVSKFAAAKGDSRSKTREELGFGPDAVLFLFMAYDLRKKGIQYLVEAAAKLRDRMGADRFGVIVVGGLPSPALSRMVDRLDLKNTMAFVGPTKEPERYYVACDVFVLPTFYDACSLVVFEAMAAGLPAITTASNGAAGIIDQGRDGMVIESARDIDQLVEAMRRFLNPEVLKSASEAARQTASRYTLPANHQRMLEIFQEAAERGEG
ncbi:MAG: glycosyltransferase family 4 protein, partial [Thermodesulfobacteriota bacterium]